MIFVKPNAAGLADGHVWRPDLEVKTPSFAPALPIIHYAGSEHLDPSAWRVGAHDHQHFELLVIERGIQTTRFGPPGPEGPQMADVSCGEGRVFLFAPGVPHAEWLEEDCSVKKLTLGFSWLGGERELPRVGLDPSGRIHDLVSWIVHDLGEAPEQNSRLSHLLVAALNEYQKHAPLEEENLAERVRQLVKTTPWEPFTVESLARSFGMGRTTFSARFRHSTGQTPMEFVRKLRLEYAYERIVSGEAPLKVIAIESGFPSPAHFSRAIHEAFGVSPRDLRIQSGRRSVSAQT